MAFDGVTIASLVAEFNATLIGGRIYKIAQPENDELLFTIKTSNGQYRLCISADPSLPLIYFTAKNKPSPLQAPNFCMLLRKHLQNGRIVAIHQPGLERIIHIDIEHLNELGDLCKKTLIVEIMGKHSNIIFCNEEMKIIDSIKHISCAVSSLREVLPGKQYFIPETQSKLELLTMSREAFLEKAVSAPMPLFKMVYSTVNGLSPILAQELCFRASLDGELPTQAYSIEDLEKLFSVLMQLKECILQNDYSIHVAYVQSQPREYAAIRLTIFEKGQGSLQSYPTMSDLIENYYEEKNTLTRIRQKSIDLRKTVQTALERNIKKYDLQLRQMKDTEKRDTYRIYGELLNTYGYSVPPMAKSCEVLNYYTNEMVTIPLDPQLSALENAQKYFQKYNKLKRTYEALTELTKEVKDQIDHLESIENALDIALKEEDLSQIREELVLGGFIHKKGTSKKERFTSKPFHYISSDGFHIYVGKNNLQNDELTFHLATGNDWWFHSKGFPGSHVIVKAEGQELPDRTFEEAARLAAYYSKARGQDKVEIDYIQKKHVKKPNAARPGFVVYYTNYSMIIDTDISSLTLVQE